MRFTIDQLHYTTSMIARPVSLDILDVESSLGVRVHVLDLSRDGDGATLLGLSELDHSLDGGVSLENSDSLCIQNGSSGSNMVPRLGRHNSEIRN
jgi:hypothetical protein